MNRTWILSVVTVGLTFGQAYMVDQSKLAPELREMTRQNRQGAIEQLDVIVQYAEIAGDEQDAENAGSPQVGNARSSSPVRTRLSSAVWGTVVRQYLHLPFAVLRVTPEQLETIANDPSVAYVSPDRDLGATHFPPWLLNEAIGYRFSGMTVPERPVETGRGIGIAIIDSGISADDYLKDPATNCTTSRVVYNENFVSGENTTNDVYGHGTHVAGIAAGNGKCLPGAYLDFRGVATEASIVNLRALDSRGQGKDSAVIGAIDRAIALKSTYKIKVINLLLGALSRPASRPIRSARPLSGLGKPELQSSWRLATMAATIPWVQMATARSLRRVTILM